MMTNLEN